ncbi:IS3 family transposase [Nocardia sp. R7R-8]|uniref:IS3 family transposase n=1 Tax=Nocardia sp. R7R-8 TaxID=3459304 RepID=UPI00403DD8E0
MAAHAHRARQVRLDSFLGRMQTELLNRQRWRTRIELAKAIFEYLDLFDNRQRHHSAPGMRTPIEYEMIQPPIQPWPEVQHPDSTKPGNIPSPHARGHSI